MSDIAGGLLGAAGSFVTSLMNKNFQEEQNRITREREDTAVQRRVADLKAAGLSPVLAAGEGASASNMPAVRVGDPVEAGMRAMTQTQSVATSKAEKIRVEQATKREKAETEFAESKARQEKIRADVMEQMEAWGPQAGVDMFETGFPKGMKIHSPEAARQLGAVLQGNLERRRSAAAGSLTAAQSEMEGLNLEFFKKLGSPALGGALLRLLGGVVPFLGGIAAKGILGRGKAGVSVADPELMSEVKKIAAEGAEKWSQKYRKGGSR